MTSEQRGHTESKAMDAETLEALRGSIAKWEARLSEPKYPGRRDCPLCGVFNDNGGEEELDCIGCPVFERTREKYCGGTPVHRYGRLMDEFGRDANGLTELAQQELDFLKSLLPKEAQSDDLESLEK